MHCVRSLFRAIIRLADISTLLLSQAIPYIVTATEMTGLNLEVVHCPQKGPHHSTTTPPTHTIMHKQDNGGRGIATGREWAGSTGDHITHIPIPKPRTDVTTISSDAKIWPQRAPWS